MPIDPRIPMSYQAPQKPQNPFFDWKTLAQMTELRAKQEERQLKTTKAARLAELVRGATKDVDGRKEIDWGAVSTGIAETDPELGLTLGLGQYKQARYAEEAEQAKLGTTKSKLAAQEQQIKTHKDLVAFTGQQADAALRGNSQAHYDQGKAEMERVAPGSTAALPPIWGDEAKTRLKEIFDKSQSVKDVLDRQGQALDLQNKALDQEGKKKGLILDDETIRLRRQQQATEAEQLRTARLAQEQKRQELADKARQVPQYFPGTSEASNFANVRVSSLMQEQGLTGKPPITMLQQAMDEAKEYGLELKRQEGVAGAKIAANKAYETEVGKPLEGPALTRMNTMLHAEEITSALLTEFTPEERATYVGLGGLRKTVQEIQQIYHDVTTGKADPKYARFITLVSNAMKEAGTEGGQNISGTEKDIYFGYIPTGKEWSAEEFEQKLKLSGQRQPAAIDREITLTTTPRGELAARRKRGDMPKMFPPTPGGATAPPVTTPPGTAPPPAATAPPAAARTQPPPTATPPAKPPITADEIGRMMQRSGLSADEVIKRLTAQGYRIEGLD